MATVRNHQRANVEVYESEAAALEQVNLVDRPERVEVEAVMGDFVGLMVIGGGGLNQSWPRTLNLYVADDREYRTGVRLEEGGLSWGQKLVSVPVRLIHTEVYRRGSSKPRIVGYVTGEPTVLAEMESI